MKTLINIAGFLIIVFGSASLGFLAGKDGRGLDKETVTEKLMDIQRTVGAKVDAEIGPETTLLVNAWVKYEKPEVFNKFARPYFEELKNE